MSGLVRGKIECVVNTNFNRNTMSQACFKLAYDFFTSHPNYTLIALQYGATGGPAAAGAGTGVGFYDQPNSFGWNGWFVVRANATVARPFDVYHLFHWNGAVNAGAPAFGTTPGNPGLVNGSTSPINNNNTYIGHSAAIGIGGTGGSGLSPSNGNPWKGTSAANGADTKGTSVWGAPSGGGTGVMIFPRSNNNFGAHRQLTQNTGGTIASFSGNDVQIRLSFIGDDDSFVIILDNEASVMTLSYSGLYTVRNNLPVTYPFCVVDSYNGMPWSVTNQSVYGDAAGTSSQQGGIVQALSGTVASLQLDQLQNFATDMSYWPNKNFVQPTYDEHDIPVGIFEIGPPNVSGLLGQLDFVRLMYNVPANAVKSDFSRIFVGTNTMQDRKYSVPWDNQNNTPPRSGLTRNGVTFVAAAGV